MSASNRAVNGAVEINMGKKDRLFTLETQVLLPRSRNCVFPFFADAVNLESITPPWLHFEILTPLPIDMRAGTIIEYRLRLHGFTMCWLTEITLWDPPLRFVDEQRHGPYRTWIHEHTFAEHEDGCEMRDFVQYALLGGWLTNRLFVRRSIRRIFEYRAQRLSVLFTP